MDQRSNKAVFSAQYYDGEMRSQFTLAAFLLWSATIPVWLCVVAMLGFGPGWGAIPGAYGVVPVALLGITVALHRILRGRPNAWAIAALLAPLIAVSSIAVVAVLVHRYS